MVDDSRDSPGKIGAVEARDRGSRWLCPPLVGSRRFFGVTRNRYTTLPFVVFYRLLSPRVPGLCRSRLVSVSLKPATGASLAGCLRFTSAVMQCFCSGPCPLVTVTNSAGCDLPSRPLPPVQLGDAFYDLTGWRKLHPAGNHWIDRFAVSGNKGRTGSLRAGVDEGNEKGGGG